MTFIGWWILWLQPGNAMSQTSGHSLSLRERSQIVSQIRRRLSTAFMQANGSCLLKRVANVGLKLAVKRIEWAMQEDMRMRQERRAKLECFP